MMLRQPPAHAINDDLFHRSLSGVTSPEADGGQSTHSGLADIGSDSSSSAVRAFPIAPSMSGAKPAGKGPLKPPPVFPAGHFSDGDPA